MIRDIQEINLPSYATLNSATITMQNMGDQTIEATISIDRDITPNFSEDWVIKFRGVEFIHPLKTPQASKSNEKFNPEYPLTFYHKGIYDLKRKFFFSLPSVESGTAVADKYEASLSLNVVDFVDAYSKVLAYHYGDYITIDLNPNPNTAYDKEPTSIAISYTKMWDLLSAFYENYKISWWIEPKSPSGYVVKVGYNRNVLSSNGTDSHPLSYGFDGGLLKIERQVQSPDIINILLGRGGDKNLPYRYFQDQAEDSDGGGDESTFRADPDWIPELANIMFDGLRDINFRYYIQGWKDKSANAARRYVENLHWAYDMGYTATSFDPVEYVKDDASIAKYGELWGGLQKIEDIYPSIQGVFLNNQGRADQVVDVSEPQDEENELPEPEVIIQTLTGGNAQALNVPPNESRELVIDGGTRFLVKDGYKANIGQPVVDISGQRTDGDRSDLSSMMNPTGASTIVVTNQAGVEMTGVDLPSGGYYSFKIKLTLTNNSPYWANMAITCRDVELVQSILTDSAKNTFNVWIKNVWETSKYPSETDKAYAERVWTPILGNYLGDKAALVFSTGLLSISEDYEFLLTKFPEYDTSKSIDCDDENGNTINVPSHWKLTLRRSDAEYDATGKWLPNAKIHANAGEYFFFVGIDMPHNYVVWAEQRLNAYKLQQLDDVSDINPTWAIELSKIRINHPQAGETVSLISQLQAGVDVDLYSKWFISDPSKIKDDKTSNGETYRTTIQTLTFKYEEPKQNSPGLLPSVSVTLSDKPLTTASSVSLLQGSVDALTSRINSMSAPYVIDVIKSADNVTNPTDTNVFSAKRVTTSYIDKTKDDTTTGALTSEQGFKVGDFVPGVSGAGMMQDGETTYAEVDVLRVRKKAFFEQLDIVDVKTIGGKFVVTPGGGVTLSDVYDVSVGGVVTGYLCKVKTEEDGVKTEIRIKTDDLVMCKTYNIKDGNRYYWRRCTEAGEDYIILSNTDYDTSTANDRPKAEDDVVQFGCKGSDTLRQNAIVISTVDGNSPNITLFKGINSYSLTGCETIELGVNPTTGIPYQHIYGDAYIGPKDQSTYVDYDSSTKTLRIKGKILAESTIGDMTLEQYINSLAASNTDVKNYIDTAVGNAKNELQAQIDGAIESFFYGYNPTESNYPASEWTTDALKEQHANDTFTNISTGHSWRWVKDGETWKWVEITDTATVQALALAGQAKDTADGKRRVFLTTPTTPYDAGDIWVNATYTGVFSNDIARCSTSRVTGSFQIGDWGLASKYTDDTAITTFINGAYASDKQALETQIDGKAETWYQSTDPSATWTTEEQKDNHLGDLWYNTSTSTVSGVGAGKAAIYRKTNGVYSWVVDATVPQSVFDEIDGKVSIYISKPSSYQERDLWILEAQYELKDATYPAGTIVVALQTSTTWNKDHWVKKDRYTDDATANKALTEAGKYAYLKAALGDASSINGGLALFSVVSLGQYNSDLTTHIAWSGLNGIIPDGRDVSGASWNPSSTSLTNKPAPISYWGGGDMLDLAEYYYWDTASRSWVLKSGATTPSRVAQAVDRMDGTGYRAGGNLWWDKSGNVHADPMSFFVGENTVGNVMQLFTFNPSNNVQWPAVTSATPTRQFTQIIIGDGTNGVKLEYDATNKALKFSAVGSDSGLGSIYATGYVSALGAGSASGGSGSGSGSGVDALSLLVDVALDNPASGQILRYDGSHWVNVSLESVTPSLDGYATQTWVNSKVDGMEACLLDLDARVQSLAVTNSVSELTASHVDTETLGAEYAVIGTLESSKATAEEFIGNLTGTATNATNADNATNANNANTLGGTAKDGLLTSVTAANGSVGVCVGGKTINATASGTWGISISGNAATATNALNDHDGNDIRSTYLKVEDFEKMFVKEEVSAGVYRIKALYDFYSVGYVSALGSGSASSGSGSGSGAGLAFGRLDDWANYNPNGTDALSAKLGYGLKSAIESNDQDIANLTTTTNSLNTRVTALEARTGLEHFTLAQSGSGNAVTNVAWSNNTLTVTKGAKFALSSDLDLLSSAVLELNGRVESLSVLGSLSELALSHLDADTLGAESAVIGSLEVDSLIATLPWSSITEKPTTIDGYGITDAYTKTAITNLLASKADKAITISAGTGLTGGGTLAENRTLALATCGSSGTYTKVSTDIYGRVTSGSTPTTLAGYSISNAYTKDETTSLITAKETQMQASLFDLDARLQSLAVVGSLSELALSHLDAETAGIENLAADLIEARAITATEGFTGNLSGNASTATRLAGTSSYTAWGQTYWQNGVPQSISGSLTGVTTITASGNVKAQSFRGSYICIECDSAGNLGDYGKEMNVFGGHLYLQHRGSDTTNPTGNIFMCSTGGNVGIGTTSPACALHVIGDIAASGAITALSAASSSDIRLKKNIAYEAMPLERMASVMPAKFEFLSQPGITRCGAIAQELRAILPEAIGTDARDFLTVEYGNAALYLVLSLAREVLRLKQCLQSSNNQLTP